MGGLPGAGKSVACKSIRREFGGNIVKLDIDDMRKIHPKHRRIAREGRKRRVRRECPDYYSIQTGEFAWQVKEGLRTKLENAGYNMILDGTARNPGPIINAARTLKQKGYTSSAVFVGTDKDTAWQGTQDRFNRQIKYERKLIGDGKRPDFSPRAVGRDYFDSVVADIPKSIGTLQMSDEFEQIRLVDRLGAVHRDHRKYPWKNLEQKIHSLITGKKIPALIRNLEVSFKCNLPFCIVGNNRSSRLRMGITRLQDTFSNARQNGGQRMLFAHLQ